MLWRKHIFIFIDIQVKSPSAINTADPVKNDPIKSILKQYIGTCNQEIEILPCGKWNFLSEEANFARTPDHWCLNGPDAESTAPCASSELAWLARWRPSNNGKRPWIAKTTCRKIWTLTLRSLSIRTVNISYYYIPVLICGDVKLD